MAKNSRFVDHFVLTLVMTTLLEYFAPLKSVCLAVSAPMVCMNLVMDVCLLCCAF